MSRSRAWMIAPAVALLLCAGACGGDGGASAPGMILIAGGATWIGCDTATETACTPEESPRHGVTIASFEIDEREVTVDAFVAFLADHGNTCGDDPCADDFFDDSPVVADGETWAARAGLGSHPMTKVTWFGAEAYCGAMSKRLCSEAEWEVAALGACSAATCDTSKPLYPWGDEAPTCALAHMFDGSAGCGTGATAPVGSLPEGASPDGVLDMAGNAWEWVADSWHADYTGAPTDGGPWIDASPDYRVVRGGGLGSGPDRLRGSHRWNAGPGNLVADYGFRCCR